MPYHQLGGTTTWQTHTITLSHSKLLKQQLNKRTKKKEPDLFPEQDPRTKIEILICLLANNNFLKLLSLLGCKKKRQPRIINFPKPISVLYILVARANSDLVSNLVHSKSFLGFHHIFTIFQCWRAGVVFTQRQLVGIHRPVAPVSKNLIQNAFVGSVKVFGTSRCNGPD